MSTLTKTINTNETRSLDLGEKLKKIGVKLLAAIPTAAIIGLIALYYVQLSHMG